MQAMVQDRYGSAEVMHLEHIDKPAIGVDEVLVRVRAAGVNPADWAIMSGLPYVARPIYGMRKPKHSVRGTDVAGVVEAIGTNITRFKVGDAVFGWCTGSYAEYAAADQDSLAIKPANVSFEQAASVPMAAMVALQALRDHGNVQAGQTVLINGASGGIGTFAVQIAKSLGAEVTGVCSTANMDLVRSIGADQAIDYTREDFTQSGKQYDFILDNVSNHSMAELLGALTPTGSLVPNGGNFQNRWFAGGGRVLSAHLRARFAGQRIHPFLVTQNQADLVALKVLIEAGAITPVVDRTYALRETGTAIDHVGEGHARGKVAITV